MQFFSVILPHIFLDFFCFFNLYQLFEVLNQNLNVNFCFSNITFIKMKFFQLAYGFVGILSIYLVLGSFAELVCNLIGFGYPVYASVCAIRTEIKEDDTQWLTYWTVFASFSLLDFFSESIMSVLPIYWLVKVAFLLYLALPQTNGSIHLYHSALEPFVAKVEAYMSKYLN